LPWGAPEAVGSASPPLVGREILLALAQAVSSPQTSSLFGSLAVSIRSIVQELGTVIPMVAPGRERGQDEVAGGGLWGGVVVVGCVVVVVVVGGAVVVVWAVVVPPPEPEVPGRQRTLLFTTRLSLARALWQLRCELVLAVWAEADPTPEAMQVMNRTTAIHGRIKSLRERPNLRVPAVISDCIGAT
jgi:hypothetical protein